jgi:hypothetical protein
MKFIGILVSTFLMFIFAGLVSAFTLSLLWGWFVCPVFSAAPLTERNAGMGHLHDCRVLPGQAGQGG